MTSSGTASGVGSAASARFAVPNTKVTATVSSQRQGWQPQFRSGMRHLREIALNKWR